MAKEPSYPENFSGDDDEGLKIDWPAVFQGILESLWLCLFVTALVVLITVKVVYQWPDQYSSSARIQIDVLQQSSSHNEVLSDSNQDVDVKSYNLTQIELLKREEVLEKTVKDLGLAQYFGTTEDGAVQILSTRILGFRYVPGTQILEVSAVTRTPDMAPKIANSICENYIRLSAIDRLRIPPEILKLFQELDAVSNDKSIKNSEEARSFYGNELDKKISTLPTVVQDPTLIKLRDAVLELQQQKALFQNRYTPDHPKMKALDEQILNLNKEMEQQKDRVLSSLRASILGEFSVRNSRIIESAIPNSNPSGPHRSNYIFLAGFGSLAFMFLLVGLMTIFNRRVTREDDFKFLDGLPFFGYIPEIADFRKFGSSQKVQKNIVPEFKDNTVLADHSHEICTNIIFSMPSDKNKVILLTGILPEDGKTFVSCLTALSMASLGNKVLLVDIDARLPSVHLNFGLENDKGFTDVLIGQTKWQDAVKKVDGAPTLDVLTAGVPTRNAPALLMSDVMAKFINEVRGKYDKIILDAPPSLYMPDAFIIGKLTDGIVIIFRSGRVVISEARKIHSRMLNAKLPVIGGVINRANVRKFNGFNNYIDSHSKYYHK